MTKCKKSRWMDTEDDEGKPLPEKTEEYEHRPAYGRMRRQYEGKHVEPTEIDTRHADFGDLTVTIYDDQDQAAYEPPDMNLEQVPAQSLPGGLKVPERAKRYVDSICSSAPHALLLLTSSQDEPVLTWRDGFHDLYLDKVLSCEGRGRIWLLDERCRGCEVKPASIRCRDCLGFAGFCRECILRRHEYAPFHVLEVRSHKHFAPRSNFYTGVDRKVLFRTEKYI
jgi:hypothetical protein